MTSGIKDIIKDGNGNTLIVVALGAAALANCIPTVADGYYFYLQQKWKHELNEGKINPSQYWKYNIVNYYTITAGYYVMLLLLMLALKKNDFSFNMKLLLAMVGGGAVVAVAIKNIEKDEATIILKDKT